MGGPPEAPAVMRDDGRPAAVDLPGSQPAPERDDPGLAATSKTAPVDPETVQPTVADEDLLVVMRGVSRTFDHRLVVDHIDLTVPRGTILGIIAPSPPPNTTPPRL